MTADPITFSIIVNTMDRAASVRTLLRALEAQSYPHFEVLVVVGPTPDNTLEVLSEYTGGSTTDSSTAGRIRLLRCPEANLSQSRNIGLLAARGDIVAFIDDDAVPPRRWLEQYAHLFADPQIDASGGSVWAIHPNLSILQFRLGSFSSLAEQVDVRQHQAERLAPVRSGRAIDYTYATRWMTRFMGTNMLARRQTFYDIQGFDEFYRYLADEADLALRLEAAGKRLYPLKEGIVYHIPGSSRNRVAFTNKGKWWIRTEAKVYLTLRHGAASGETRRAILTRGLYAAAGNFPWYLGLLRSRQMSPLDFVNFTIHETAASLNAATQALFQRRKVIPAAAIAAASQSTEPILPFQNSSSPLQPVVDPISGRQPDIRMPDPPLRICLLSSGYPPAEFGGVARLTHLMAQGLFECGHTVHVVTRGEREETTFRDGAYVHKIPLQLERYERYRALPSLYHTLNYSHNVYEKVRRLLLNDGIQMVDTPLWQYEGLVTLRAGLLPVLVRLVTAQRQIADIHRRKVDEFTLMGDLEQALVEEAHWLLPNTQATLKAVTSVYNVDPASKPYTIVPYGLVPAPDDQVRPLDLQTAQNRPLTVLFVGRLEKRKGALDLFEAIPQVLRKLPDTRFVLTGADNSLHDGFLMQTGMDYPAYFAAHYPQCLPNVTFSGMVSDEELQQHYQACDLFVAPSLYESFGLIYLEAMNYAKPAIGCRSGGVPEVIDHGQTGLLVDPEAPAQLAEAIISLLQSPEKLRSMGLAGRERILTHFNYTTMARNFAAVYRQAIQAFQPRYPVPPTGENV